MITASATVIMNQNNSIYKVSHPCTSFTPNTLDQPRGPTWLMNSTGNLYFSTSFTVSWKSSSVSPSKSVAAANGRWRQHQQFK